MTTDIATESQAPDLQNTSAPITDPPSAGPTLLENELALQADKYLRLAADFDNFKKRTRRDSEQQAAAQKESFIRDLLPVLDNLERALACDKSNTSPQLHQGVEMTLKQLAHLLHHHGIESVEDVGKPFDPHRHEAISVGHDRNQPDHVVLEVVQRGYCRHDKVFRPAKVIVNDPGHSPGVNHAS